MITNVKSPTGKRSLFLIAIGVLSAVLLIGLNTPPSHAQKKGDVVAVVNGESITKDAFYNRLEQAAGQQTLDQMITETLILQAEAKYDVHVTADEIKAEVGRVKEKFPNEAAFRGQLARYNLTETQLEKEIRLNLILQKISRQGVTVTDDEIKSYFEKNKEKLGEPEQVRLRHILVQSKDDAEALLKQLHNGTDFAKLAKEKSIDTASAKNGGDLGFVSKDSPLDPAFKEAALKLEEGELSGPVKSKFGWHIIRLDERKEAKAATLDTSRESIRKILIKKKSRPVAQILSELRNKAKVDVQWDQYTSLANDPTQNSNTNAEKNSGASTSEK